LDELLFQNEAKNQGADSKSEFYLGTVTASDSTGIQLTMDGESEPMTKRYRQILTGRTITVGARVVVVKISGTYVVLGQLSAPDA
jgi:hypothetical protein